MGGETTLKSLWNSDQEWRVSRKHVNGEVFSYPQPKIYGKVFLKVEDVEEHFVLWLQCVLSRQVKVENEAYEFA